jgi:putative transposase
LKKQYQIDKQRAAQQFHKQAGESDEQIQFALPLPEILELAQRGLMNLALAAFTKLAEEMMQWEANILAGPKNQANTSRENSRWGTQAGFCVVGGQKVRLKRPRVRDVRDREVPLGGGVKSFV